MDYGVLHWQGGQRRKKKKNKDAANNIAGNAAESIP